MGVTWIRADVSMLSNPKIIALLERGGPGFRAFSVRTMAMLYAGMHDTGGFIPDLALKAIHGRRIDMQVLVEADLLEVVPGGWLIHDWDEYQFSSDTAAFRRDRAKHAAAVRWSKQETKAAKTRA